MKKTLGVFPVLIILLLSVAMAHGEEIDGMDEMEEEGIGHQMAELLPFEHVEENHWFAFVMSILLWLSFIYTLYSLYKKMNAKN